MNHKMLEKNASRVLNISNYLRFLDCTIQSKSLKQGKIIHQSILKFDGRGLNGHSLLLDKLTRLYISCNRHQLAHRVFNSIPIQERKNKTILWNQMIRAYAWDGPPIKAVDLYNEMVECGITPTKYTFPFVLKACSALQDLETGIMIHEDTKRLNLDNDIYICTALVDFYVKCGCIEDAMYVFDKMPEKDIVAWNAMIAGFSLHGMSCNATALFYEMLERGVNPNSSTIVTVLPVIAEEGMLKEGKATHSFCLRRGLNIDVVVGTAILDMYGKCEQLTYAKKMFDALSFKNEVMWSAMIGACVTCNSIEEGLEMFGEMRTEVGDSPSRVIVATIVRGCAKLNDLYIGRQMHSCTIKWGLCSDLMVGNTLLSMYAKCGSLNDAMKFFEGISLKDSVSYTAMISGCVQNGYAEEALQMFRKMQLSGVEPELATMKGFLPACSYLATPQHGACGHGYSVVRGFTSDISICNALIDMYSKCGKLDISRRVFDTMHVKDVVSWNSMIVGYGIHGLGKEAILLLQEMQKFGQKPDEVTFIALISACSHSGLVNEGKHWFEAMSREFNIIPKMDHYFCIVDLLGRAGFLNESYDFINKMPFEPDAHLWNTLLAACRIHKNVEIGEEISNKIQRLGPASTGNFVLLSNLYTTAQRWDDAAMVRIKQKDLGFNKRPGCSWIEANGKVHAFVGGDWSHPEHDKINKKLDELVTEIKKMGYSTESGSVYQDVEDEEKEGILLHHSEKIAVAFGIISVQGDKPIVVTKNLRVCCDCHEALKYMTIVSKREIIVRDTSRFHHFRDGTCSCGEFW